MPPWNVGRENCDAILQPNGQGALQADSDGNARGVYAVDLRYRRLSSRHLVGGNCSVWFYWRGINRPFGMHSRDILLKPRWRGIVLSAGKS